MAGQCRDPAGCRHRAGQILGKGACIMLAAALLMHCVVRKTLLIDCGGIAQATVTPVAENLLSLKLRI